MWTDFLTMLLLGLVSSLHCVTMCGPIIAITTVPFAGNPADSRWILQLDRQFLYHLGRGIAYSLIGLILAAAGATITALFPARMFGGILQLTIGLVIVVLTIYSLVTPARESSSSLTGFLKPLFQKWMMSGTRTGMFLLGLATGLLPCGVLYAAFGYAAFAPSAAAGAAYMALFWLGTTPLLLVVGLASGTLFRTLGRYARAAIVVALISTGSWLMFKGVRAIAAQHGDRAPCCSQTHR